MKRCRILVPCWTAAVCAMAQVALAQDGFPPVRVDRQPAVDQERLIRELHDGFDVVRHWARDRVEQSGRSWDMVETEFYARAREVSSAAEQYEVLVGLLEATGDEDGECYRSGLDGTGVRSRHWIDLESRSPGLVLCRNGSRVLVQNSWGPAARAGLRPGSEVHSIDELPVLLWLHRRADGFAEFWGLDGTNFAHYLARHGGLSDVAQSTVRIEASFAGSPNRIFDLRRTDGTIRCQGPCFPSETQREFGPEITWDRSADRRVAWIHFRSLSALMPLVLDQLMGEIGEVQGLCLDLRGCDRGACDELRFLSRFIAAGDRLHQDQLPSIESRGRQPFSGPVVVLVDGGTRGCAETVAAVFQRFDRAWILGEGETAGQLAYHKTLTIGQCVFSFTHRSLPSPLMHGRWRGSVIPDEALQYRDTDLRSEAGDTLRNRAIELLRRWKH